MEFFSLKLKKLLLFQEALPKPEKQINKKNYSLEIFYMSAKNVVLTFSDGC